MMHKPTEAPLRGWACGGIKAQAGRFCQGQPQGQDHVQRIGTNARKEYRGVGGVQLAHGSADEVVQHTAVLKKAPLDGHLEEARDAFRRPVRGGNAADEDQPPPGREVAADILQPHTIIGQPRASPS